MFHEERVERGRRNQKEGDAMSERTVELKEEARVALGELSARELEVFWMEVDGRGRKDMASSLGISCKTVGVHVHNMRGKLGVKGLGEFLRLAAGWGLVG
jgi:DNA-binding CsgD family transcriptional regulator